MVAKSVKAAIASSKGGVGKSALAEAFVLSDSSFAVATNEPFSEWDVAIDEESVCNVEFEESFPEFPDDLNVIYDLSGTISRNGKSIMSALKDADVVVVVFNNTRKSITHGINYIIEAKDINPNIICVANKITKRRKKGEITWESTEDYRAIRDALDQEVSKDIPLYPVRETSMFARIEESGTGMSEVIEANPLFGYHFREPKNQIENLLNAIKEYGR
jgi:MinD superfamily P-loop ATPase